MSSVNNQLPKNWHKLSLNNFYYYKDILVRRIDREDSKVELTALDFNNKRRRVVAQDIVEAMHIMEKELSFYN